MVELSDKEGEHAANENNNRNGVRISHKSKHVNYLNIGEDDQMEIEGFIPNQIKTYLVQTIVILTFGLMRLFLHWYPNLHLRITHDRCSLRDAEKVLIIDTYKKLRSSFVKKVEILKASDCDREHLVNNLMAFNLCDGRQKRLYEARIIRCKKLTYIWDDEFNNFYKLAGFDKGISKAQLHMFKGQTKDKQNSKRIVYGDNEINVPVQTIMTLLILEGLTPFYIFQLFSLIIWVAEQYYYYTIALVIMSVSGITTSIIQTRKNQKKLKGTVHSMDTAIVCRGGDVFEEIPTSDLVPGDVIAIPSNGCAMQCDAVLTKGSCVANESMLTGESVPIAKTILPNNSSLYNLKEDVNHTLFCGTKIIQTRIKANERVLAVVIRTGYLTAKGELVRSILYPPPADFKFENDSYKFIAVLAIIATVGVIYTIVSKSFRNINTSDIILKALDVFTIAVPPALPAAMTVGKLYALNRLKDSYIYCINSRVINVSGSVDCICFDKTGTLTEDELDMWGIVPVIDTKIQAPLQDVKVLRHTSPFIQGMASCHSLSVINNELGGDPLDIKMFESTGWDLVNPDGTTKNHNIMVRPKEFLTEDNIAIEILKQFQFSSQLQRMSVVVKLFTEESYLVFCKGSPEIIMSLSRPNSVPEDLLERLNDYTSQGYRVIALGRKSLKVTGDEDFDKLSREQVECDLDFLGLVVLENKLKPQTAGVLRTLKNANMKLVMITGDNIQTALHVAKDCQMVSESQAIVEVITHDNSKYRTLTVDYLVNNEPIVKMQYNGDKNDVSIEKAYSKDYCFAITGKSWANIVDHAPELVPRIIAKGTVFARMSGMQKQQLVEMLKNLGYYVAMCGDGANDCGALRAAHVGISLSEAESSVASPFTYKEQNISCIPKVIKEGRAALITSFGVFKLMMCSSLLQFASVIILYNIDANLTSLQFLFIDICLVLNLASVFGNTKAHDVLDKTPPRTSLMEIVPIASVVFFMVLATGFQLFASYWIESYQWFEPFIYDEKNSMNYLSYENFAVFTVSIFEYCIMVIVFSKGKPYRKPLYTNVALTLSLIFTITVCAYITLDPADWVLDLLELKAPPLEGRYAVILICIVCFVTCFIAEDFIVDYIIGRIVMAKFRKVMTSKRKYLGVLRELEGNPYWPNGNIVFLSHMNEVGQINNAFIGSQNTLITTI